MDLFLPSINTIEIRQYPKYHTTTKRTSKGKDEKTKSNLLENEAYNVTIYSLEKTLTIDSGFFQLQ